MSANIADLSLQYGRVMAERNAKRLAGMDPGALPAYLTYDAVNRIHPRSLDLKVASITSVTDTMKTFRLVLNDPSDYLAPFVAGQYLSVHADINGVHTSRPISISSSPLERGYYEITVKRKPDAFLSDYFLDEVKVGDRITTSGPAGRFNMNPPVQGDHYVFLAGGSGITPFLSMIREVTDAALPCHIHLIYGCRNLADVPYLEELKKRSESSEYFRFDLVLSEPEEGWQGLTGFIGAELIEKLNIDTKKNVFFICGPGAMYNFTIPELKKLGIPGRKIRKEIFGAPADITKEPGWPETITKEDVFTLRFEGKEYPCKATETILTAFERAGIHHPSECRAGECSLCRIKLVAGDVFQTSTALVRKSDVKLGYIHPCVTYPLSDIEVTK